jgi:hypothetical protein
MKALIAAVVALALVPAASAELYKYVDKNGKTVYTDQPPTDVDAKRMSGPAVPDKGKSYVEKDKELEKGREKAREEAKKSGEAEKVAAAKKERCDNARSRLQIYTEGGRILKPGANGEREFLSDEEIEAERAKAQKQVEEACPK